ncbi:hypothetical protein V2J09_013479 [Rumex salicifolius]
MSASSSSSLSPFSSPFSPMSSAMATFSPGPIDSIGGPKKNHRLALALIIASASVILLILSLLALWIYHKFSNKPYKKKGKSSDTLKGLGPIQQRSDFSSLKVNGNKRLLLSIDYKTVESATDNFNEVNKLGVGGFGCVYKAKLEDNFYVAVKKIEVSVQDAHLEFQNEVNLLYKIQHPNIIAILGHCIHGDSKYLVYELMENGSLETLLHGPSRGQALTWHTRMKIALDIARGVEYLHEHCNPPVIHRDLKSSNVLLDSNFNAKLSDFGLAVVDGSQNKNNIKLSGTLGYVAPEYLLDGKLTEKSDVYAFGVVLLELLLGRKPVEKLSPVQCQSIVTWAMPQLTDRTKLPNIVDPAIQDTMDLKHLYQVAAVAVLCVQPEPSYRPLITDVLHSLIPLVPVQSGGTLRVRQHKPSDVSALNVDTETKIGLKHTVMLPGNSNYVMRRKPTKSRYKIVIPEIV